MSVPVVRECVGALRGDLSTPVVGECVGVVRDGRTVSDTGFGVSVPISPCTLSPSLGTLSVGGLVVLLLPTLWGI